MFGGPTSTTAPPPGGGRPQTADVAKIKGNLTHVIVSSDDLDGLNVFTNGQPILTGQLENVGVEIVAPSDKAPDGTLTGVLTYYETGADGAKQNKSLQLFPGTLEVIAKGRRIVIVCPAADPSDPFNGLELRFGTTDDGGQINNIGLPAMGVQSLRIVIAPKLVDAKLVWSEDGREDVILP